MIFKEKGYDEFLTQKIQKGLDDIEAGRVISLEESQKQTRLAIEQKIKEIEQANLMELGTYA